MPHVLQASIEIPQVDRPRLPQNQKDYGLGHQVHAKAARWILQSENAIRRAATKNWPRRRYRRGRGPPLLNTHLHLPTHKCPFHDPDLVNLIPSEEREQTEYVKERLRRRLPIEVKVGTCVGCGKPLHKVTVRGGVKRKGPVKIHRDLTHDRDFNPVPYLAKKMGQKKRGCPFRVRNTRIQTNVIPEFYV